MAKTKEQQRIYMLARYHRRRAEALLALGGCCSVCGTTEDLEIDHKDPKLKTYHLARIFAGGSERKVQAEIEKCQVLCFKHHKEKSIAERGMSPSQHGTYANYKNYGCRCAACVAANNEYSREYKRRKRASSSAVAAAAF